jgi:hypothetical protein
MRASVQAIKPLDGIVGKMGEFYEERRAKHIVPRWRTLVQSARGRMLILD